MGVIGKYNDIHKEAYIGVGTKIYSFNYIGNCVIGKNCNITNYIHLGDGCVVGDNCNIQPYVLLNSNLKLGENVFIAGGVQFYDIKYPPDGDKKTASIGNNVIIGNNSVIGYGVTIGDNSVVGAVSHVTRSIPPNEVWIGNPARYYCTREEYNDKKDSS